MHFTGLSISVPVRKITFAGSFKMIVTLLKVTLRECITKFDLFGMMKSASQTTISLSASACHSPSISFLFVFKSPEHQAGLCYNAGLISICPSLCLWFPHASKNPPLCPYLRKIKSHAWMTGSPLLWPPSSASVLRSRQRTHLLCAACFTGPTTICIPQ